MTVPVTPVVDDEPIPGRDRAAQNTDPAWRDAALGVITVLARSGAPFMASDVAERLELGEPDHANRWGAVFSTARRQGLIEPIGAAPSRRATTGRSLAYIWRGTPALRAEGAALARMSWPDCHLNPMPLDHWSTNDDEDHHAPDCAA